MNSAVSLIATVRDEAGSIRGFLDGLLEQSRPPEEIVITDGGSTDGTVAEIEAAVERSAVPIRLIEAPGANISAGRNLAIAAATHPLIAVTDAGTRPRPDWLARLLAPLEADPEVGVAAGFFLAGGSDLRQRALAVTITPQLEEIKPADFLPSSRSVAFRREWWERVGGYPEWLRHCEDLVFDLDLRQAGAEFAFAPDAIVVWDARPDLRSFARQYFSYARGDGHADLWRKRHAARYLAYAVGAVALRRRRRPELALLAAGFAAYQAKYVRRQLRRPPAESGSGRLAALALVPAIVVVGDLAKMVGFPLGTWERLRGEAGPGAGGQ